MEKLPVAVMFALSYPCNMVLVKFVSVNLRNMSTWEDMRSWSPICLRTCKKGMGDEGEGVMGW